MTSLPLSMAEQSRNRAEGRRRRKKKWLCIFVVVCGGSDERRRRHRCDFFEGSHWLRSSSTWRQDERGDPLFSCFSSFLCLDSHNVQNNFLCCWRVHEVTCWQVRRPVLKGESVFNRLIYAQDAGLILSNQCSDGTDIYFTMYHHCMGCPWKALNQNTKFCPKMRSLWSETGRKYNTFFSYKWNHHERH